jgi:hypothetical protein
MNRLSSALPHGPETALSIRLPQREIAKAGPPVHDEGSDRREAAMPRSLAGSVIFCATILAAADANAQNAPWCAIMDNDGTTQCNFSSQQQCLQTLRGVGGECIRNPAGNALQPPPSIPFSENAQGLLPLQSQDPGPPPGLDGSAMPPPPDN